MFGIISPVYEICRRGRTQSRKRIRGELSRQKLASRMNVKSFRLVEGDETGDGVDKRRETNLRGETRYSHRASSTCAFRDAYFIRPPWAPLLFGKFRLTGDPTGINIFFFIFFYFVSYVSRSAYFTRLTRLRNVLWHGGSPDSPLTPH